MAPAILSPPAESRVAAPLAAAGFGAHAARVARWLTRGGGASHADPAAVLRGRGYLYPTLLEAVGATPIDVPADEVALAFAAAAFPGKATGRRDPTARLVGDAELRLRVAAFADVLACLADRGGPEATVRAALRDADRLPADLSDDAADALAADLTGEDLLGGFLHLATLTAEQVARLAATWRTERGLVRFVRTALLSLPSQLGPLGPLFPDVPADVLAAAVGLERDARGAAGRVLDAGRVADAVADFWETTVRDRLRSGFPYFAFRSRFRTWWNQCLLTHTWERPSTTLPADSPARPVDESAADPELDMLRACREVYRVVRTTFFVRSSADPAGNNHEYRRAADAVWARRLERAADGGTPEPFEAIRSGFPWLTAAGANNLSHRVRMRVLAGVKARVDRWRTAEILGMTTPARMRDEPAVPTVAAVCRAALPSETLAGAFAAHAWLGGAVRPRHAEPPSVAGLLAELVLWAGAVGFRAAVRQGATTGGRTDGMIAELFDGRESAGKAVRFLAEDTGAFPATEVEPVVNALVGPAARSAAAPERLRAWAGVVGHEWVVPVWFMAAVERRPPAWLAARLLPDDEAAVMRMAREMTAPGGTT